MEKKHIFYDLEYQVNHIFHRLNATCIDKVIISKKGISKIKIMLPQAKRLGYTVKVHETLLVYQKKFVNFIPRRRARED